MKIRKAEEKEITEIAKIIREEIYPELSVKEMEDWIKALGWLPSPFVWWFVVEERGEILGCMRWEVWDQYKNKLLVLSSWIGIKKQYQNKGIGKKLWKESFQQVKRFWQEKGKEIAAIFTETEKEDKRACHFYQKLFEKPIEIEIPIWNTEGGTIWFFQKIQPV